MYKKPLFASLLISCVTVLSASAEVKNCNGVWTDKPCDGVALTATLAPAPTTSAGDNSADKDEMRKLYHDLDMKRLNARRTYGVQLETGLAVDNCIGAKASLEACRRITSELDDQLAQRIVNEKSVKEQQRTNDLREEEIRKQSNTVNSVTIIEDDEYHYHRHPRHPPRDRRWDDDRHDHPRPPQPPSPPKPPTNFKPQNRFQAGDGFPNR